MAFVLQEGAGRLTLVGGASLGEAVRAMSPAGRAARARQALALFERWAASRTSARARAMDAVRLVVPDPAGQAAINVLLGPLCALLLGGSSERIGMMLVVVAFMIACCRRDARRTGPPPRVARPRADDGGLDRDLARADGDDVGADRAAALVVGRARPDARRAAPRRALASFLSGAMLAPHPARRRAGADARAAGEAFSSPTSSPSSSRRDRRRRQVLGFALGLFGAGVSSALTVPFASALAVEDLLGGRRAKVAMAAQDSVTRPEDAAAPPSDAGGAPSPPPSPPDATARAASAVAACAAASTAGARRGAGGGGVSGGARRSRRLRHLAGRCASRGRRGVGAQEQVHGGDAHPLAHPVARSAAVHPDLAGGADGQRAAAAVRRVVGCGSASTTRRSCRRRAWCSTC